MGFNATNTDEGGGNLSRIDKLDPDVVGETKPVLRHDEAVLAETPLTGVEFAALPDGKNAPARHFQQSMAAPKSQAVTGTIILAKDFLGWYAGSVLSAMYRAPNYYVLTDADEGVALIPESSIETWYAGMDELDVIDLLQKKADKEFPRKEGFVVLRKPFKDRKAGEALNAVQVAGHYFTDKKDDYGNPDGEEIPTTSIDSFHEGADESEYEKVMVTMAELRPQQPPSRLTSKDTNPKDAVGIKKWRQYSCVPVPVLWELGIAMLEGARKYKRHNWRVAGVRASVYIDAAKGHIDSFWEGEDIDEESGLSHVTKAIASLAVLRDAMIQDKFVDDRPPSSNMEEIKARLQKTVDALFNRLPEGAGAYTEETNPSGYKDL